DRAESQPHSRVTPPPLPPLAKGGRMSAPLGRFSPRRFVPRSLYLSLVSGRPRRVKGRAGVRRAGQAPRLNTRISNRRGMVLVVVMGLLLLLMLIGITFFTFSSQEHSSAEYYADSAKVFSVTSDVDALFDWALEQLIIGPRDNNLQSVLWPGRHALVPNMLGFFNSNPNGTQYVTLPNDRHPFNGGGGVHVIPGTGGQAYIDQNYDGVADGGLAYNPFTLNWSPATGSGGLGYTTRAQFNALGLPALDVDYTYPDINNVFLAHIG